MGQLLNLMNTLSVAHPYLCHTDAGSTCLSNQKRVRPSLTAILVPRRRLVRFSTISRQALEGLCGVEKFSSTILITQNT